MSWQIKPSMEMHIHNRTKNLISTHKYSRMNVQDNDHDGKLYQEPFLLKTLTTIQIL